MIVRVTGFTAELNTAKFGSNSDTTTEKGVTWEK